MKEEKPVPEEATTVLHLHWYQDKGYDYGQCGGAGDGTGALHEYWFRPGSFSVEYHVLPMSVWVVCIHSGFLPQSKDMQIGVRSIGDFKLTVGESVSMNGGLSLYVSAGTYRSPPPSDPR